MVLAAEAALRWQPHPEVWLLVVGMASLYLYAVKVIGPRVERSGAPVVTRSQVRWFVLGMVVLWVASDWPVHDIAEEHLYSVHMVQHTLLTFVLPPIALLATPEWLARLVLGPGPISRFFLKLARPLPAAIVFNAVQLLTHWQVVVNNSVQNGALHYAIHTAVVFTALAVWMPVAGPLPEYRITVPAQCIHLFLTSIVPTVPAAWLALSDGVVYSAYDTPSRLWDIDATSDQQAAGLIMKLGAGGWLWFLIVVLFFRWALDKRVDRGITPRRVVVAADGTVIRVDGDRPAGSPRDDDTDLTFEAVTEAFREAPAPREPTVT